jgi:hypothetical protein
MSKFKKNQPASIVVVRNENVGNDNPEMDEILLTILSLVLFPVGDDEFLPNVVKGCAKACSISAIINGIGSILFKKSDQFISDNFQTIIV